MTIRKRKGMLIKNTNTSLVTIAMSTRTITLAPGDEELITAEEVLDETLRDYLQVRGVSIVRPAQDEEEAELKERLA
ncbi:hypothetical protein HQ496_05650 [bacterium]|nr:hypothetical protein [bacterium]